MKMPEPDAAVMARQAQIAAALAAIVPDGVIADAAGVSAYGSDGLVMYRQNPLAVVLPRTTEQVSKVLAWCHANGVKVVARGSGTSLSGGALPLADGIVLTEIGQAFDGDTKFPDWDRAAFSESQRQSHTSAGGLPYDFVLYERT